MSQSVSERLSKFQYNTPRSHHPTVVTQTVQLACIQCAQRERQPREPMESSAPFVFNSTKALLFVQSTSLILAPHQATYAPITVSSAAPEA
mmetsp:Transcript_2368/g.5980  ORF Transcript_2368/g.5980 Transcript_2368/m.5980 type:complete len:91 (-) Transcript_2368:350-622(-)